MQTVIEFRHIKKAYGDKVILKDLNLSIEKGEFVTIIGSSGCGKTTALKMVNGLLSPTEGDILIDGENIRDRNQTELRRNIGFQPLYFSSRTIAGLRRGTRLIQLSPASPPSARVLQIHSVPSSSLNRCDGQRVLTP